MKLLALDTATDACSVALYCDGAVIQRHELAPQRHTLLLLPMVRALCAEAGIAPGALEAIAVGIGPGAFTGVRVATAVAQGLAHAHDLPVLPVSTLAALAQGGFRLTGARQWLATLDARRQEIYWAHYTIDAQALAVATTAEQVSPPARVALPAGDDWRMAGTGWPAYQPQMSGLWPDLGAPPLLLPEAQDVAVLGVALLAAGGALRAEQLAPTYLRAAV
jgi:tRNA threonylcarbamoyladenosine biosynthesis protein TsaB